jgi:hypothetical protein
MICPLRNCREQGVQVGVSSAGILPQGKPKTQALPLLWGIER